MRVRNHQGQKEKSDPVKQWQDPENNGGLDIVRRTLQGQGWSGEQTRILNVPAPRWRGCCTINVRAGRPLVGVEGNRSTQRPERPLRRYTTNSREIQYIKTPNNSRGCGCEIRNGGEKKTIIKADATYICYSAWPTLLPRKGSEGRNSRRLWSPSPTLSPGQVFDEFLSTQTPPALNLRAFELSRFGLQGLRGLPFQRAVPLQLDRRGVPNGHYTSLHHEQPRNPIHQNAQQFSRMRVRNHHGRKKITKEKDPRHLLFSVANVASAKREGESREGFGVRSAARLRLEEQELTPSPSRRGRPPPSRGGTAAPPRAWTPAWRRTKSGSRENETQPRKRSKTPRSKPATSPPAKSSTARTLEQQFF